MSRNKHKDRKEGAPAVEAVIFIGASAVSMMVAESRGHESRVLDVLSQPVEIVYDIFRNNCISRENADRCVQIVRGYNELLDEYRRVGEVSVRLLATNMLMDANLLDLFVNRMRISCGLKLEVMDDGEMTRLIYQHLQHMLHQHAELAKRRLLVVHVGPGNTRLLLLDRGRITYYANYRLGTHRTSASISSAELDHSGNEVSVIRSRIRSTVEQMRHDAEETLPGPLDAMVVYGPDFHRMAAPSLEGEVVSVESLGELASQISLTPLVQRMERYGEDYASVRALLPTLLISQSVAREFEPQTIIMPAEDFPHSFLRSLMPSQVDTQVLEEEVIHFSLLLASRYRVDRGHCQQVRHLSCSLFDQLQKLHRMDRHDRLLLKVAAILHEVGTFVSPKRHHKHSQYLILNSEIFGLSRHDIEIVGLLARYHRRGVPSEEERCYAELDDEDRLRVQKLSAILRVADALDRAHARRISSFRVKQGKRRLELLVPGVHDLTLENAALSTKGQLFTDVFGYDVLLVPDVGSM